MISSISRDFFDFEFLPSELCANFLTSRIDVNTNDEILFSNVQKLAIKSVHSPKQHIIVAVRAFRGVCM